MGKIKAKMANYVAKKDANQEQPSLMGVLPAQRPFSSGVQFSATSGKRISVSPVQFSQHVARTKSE